MSNQQYIIVALVILIIIGGVYWYKQKSGFKSPYPQPIDCSKPRNNNERSYCKLKKNYHYKTEF